jgi:hypothetical protein
VVADPVQRLPHVETEGADVELNEVRLHELEVDRQARRHPARPPPPRAGMVVSEPVDVVLERVHPRGRDDPGLPHRAAKPVLLDARAVHQLRGAGDQRAERAAEPLREAERDGVERPRDLGGGTPDATAAFINRAPSRCARNLSSRAVSTIARSSSSGQTVPPEVLCVFSTATIDARGVQKSPSFQPAPRSCAGESRPR